MRCPWCAVEETPRRLHAHLSETHPDAIAFEERGERTFYQVTCPVCGDGYTHEIKPRGRDPEFVSEFRAQIRLVAFDMLVNHLLVEHDPSAEAPAGDAQPPPEAGRADTSPGRGPAPAWLTEARRQAAQTRSDPEP